MNLTNTHIDTHKYNSYAKNTNNIGIQFLKVLDEIKYNQPYTDIIKYHE